MNKQYDINEVAKIINRTPTTIKRWYRWDRSNFTKPNHLKLPKVNISKHHRKMTWDEQAIQELIIFRDNLKYGDMNVFNACWQWGERGKQILKNKTEEMKNGKNYVKNKTKN